MSPISVYVPGFTGNAKAYDTILPIFSTPETVTGVSMPDAQPETGCGLNRAIAISAAFWKKNVSRSHAYMGQTEDIKAIHEHVAKNVGNEPMAMYGCCRSGSAVVTYAAEHNPHNLQAMILEAPSSNMPATVKPWLANHGLPVSLDKKFWRVLFPKYPKDAVAPVDAIKNIKNKNLPILILHGKSDANIPYAQGLELYTAFKKQGFDKVHFATLTGKHAFLLRDDKENYLKAVHTFYKQYGLPHDEKYATGNIEDYSYDLQQAQNQIDEFEIGLHDTMRRRQKQIALLTVVAAAGVSYKYRHGIKNFIQKYYNELKK